MTGPQGPLAVTDASAQTSVLAAVILAAGKGTRMRSALPKVLHPIGNAPMLHHAMLAAQAVSPERVAIVVGHGAEAVGEAARALDPGARIAVQEEQLGTGHAVLSARDALDGQATWLNSNADYTVIIEGHADEQGTREYNLALGARRANAVREYLIGAGVGGERIQRLSYGKDRPGELRSL